MSPNTLGDPTSSHGTVDSSRTMNDMGRRAVMLVVGLLAVAGCGSDGDDEPTSAELARRDEILAELTATTPPRVVAGYEQSCPGADHLVSYRVSGNVDGQALITYSTPSGISQKEQALPFEWELCFGEFDFASVSVQNPSDSGTVQCRIISDGDVLATNSSSGAYVIASCTE